MYNINSFLQKRKLSVSRNGIFTMVMAYVTSFVLLILGSDCVASINSRAARVDEVSYEATEQITKEDYERLKLFRTLNQYQAQINSFDYIELYDVDEVRAVSENVEKQVNAEQRINDTFGTAILSLDKYEYNTLMDELVASQTLELKALEKEEDGIESLSVASEATQTFLSVTKSEVEMLERIVEAEATGEDLKGRILVANVIFNRMQDEEFPDSIEGVIFQRVDGKYQFSPIKDERYWSVDVSKKTKEAVKCALEGEDYSKGALFFMARDKTRASSAKWFDRNLKWLFEYGGHEFYKNK